MSRRVHWIAFLALLGLTHVGCYVELTETTSVELSNATSTLRGEETFLKGIQAPVTSDETSDPVTTTDVSSADPSAIYDAVPLIPREQFFGNPEKARARISPDGRRLAFLAPVDGVINVWVAPADDLDAAKAVTADTSRGVWDFQWAYTNRHLLYSKDNDGDEQNHIYAIDLESGEIRDLTPLENISAQFEGISDRHPNEILVGINDRAPHQFHDIYKVNLLTGERELVQQNPGFAGFMTDDDYNIRFAIKFTPQASQLYLVPDEEEGWKEFLEIEPADAQTTAIIGFNKTGEKVYLLDSRDRNTAALKLLDLATGEEELIAENDRADISEAIVHPTEKTIQAVGFTYARREWQILDDAIAGDLAFLADVADGEFQVTSQTLDNTKWTVAYIVDDGPIEFYLYHRGETPRAEFLFTSQPSLAELPLAKMNAEIITSRDGLALISYLTLPLGTDDDGDFRPTTPLPMVLDVHGGPWARDSWGYNTSHQLWANRGYAVLSVNFRGSTGLGKDFLNAANGQWGGKMHDDLIDAVDWAVAMGIADRDRIAIMGGSYGGYATLVGLTQTPEVFACGIDVVGPSSLITLMENVPPYWIPLMPIMKVRIGDPETEEGRAFLLDRSPLTHVDQIVRPLLIVQGAHDPRVKQQEADQIVAAMNERQIPVTYLLFHDEGHGLQRPENRFAENAIAEAFLAEHLGGRSEPVGSAFEGADFTVPSGADQVPGLSAALK